MLYDSFTLICTSLCKDSNNIMVESYALNQSLITLLKNLSYYKSTRLDRALPMIRGLFLTSFSLQLSDGLLCSCAIVVRLLCDCAIVVRLLCCCAIVVRLLCDCCAIVVRLLYDCAIVVLLFYSLLLPNFRAFSNSF